MPGVAVHPAARLRRGGDPLRAGGQRRGAGGPGRGSAGRCPRLPAASKLTLVNMDQANATFPASPRHGDRLQNLTHLHDLRQRSGGGEAGSGAAAVSSISWAYRSGVVAQRATPPIAPWSCSTATRHGDPSSRIGTARRHAAVQGRERARAAQPHHHARRAGRSGITARQARLIAFWADLLGPVARDGGP